MAAAAPLWPPTPTPGAGTADERRPLNPADGAATGGLRRAEGGPPRRARGLVADACLVLPLWLVLWLPAYREDAHGVVAPDAAKICSAFLGRSMIGIGGALGSKSLIMVKTSSSLNMLSRTTIITPRSQCCAMSIRVLAAILS